MEHLEETRKKLEEQIKSIEKNSENQLINIKESEINLWFNGQLLVFLKQKLEELPPCPAETNEDLNNSLIK